MPYSRVRPAAVRAEASVFLDVLRRVLGLSLPAPGKRGRPLAVPRDLTVAGDVRVADKAGRDDPRYSRIDRHPGGFMEAGPVVGSGARSRAERRAVDRVESERRAVAPDHLGACVVSVSGCLRSPVRDGGLHGTSRTPISIRPGQATGAWVQPLRPRWARASWAVSSWEPSTNGQDATSSPASWCTR